jgi:hypothetical protein
MMVGPATVKKNGLSAAACCPRTAAAAVAAEQGPARPGKAALGEQNRCAASAELLGPHRPVMSGRGSGPIVDLRRLGVHLGRPGLESRWWS